MERRSHQTGMTEDDAAFAARLLAFLFAAGGTLGVLVVVLPHAAAMDEPAVLAVAGIACVVAASLVATPVLLAGFLQPVIACGTVLITAALWFSGGGGAAFALFYVWVGLFVFYFFSAKRALVHVALVAAAYGAALAFGPDAVASPATLWLLTLGTMLVAGTLVGRLIGEVRARSADLEVVARVSRDLTRRGGHSGAREAICEAAREVSGSAAAVLFEPDTDRGLLICSAAAGGSAPRLRLPLRDPSYGAVAAFQTGLPRFIANLAGDPRVPRALLDETPLASCLCQPVLQDGTVVGVLVVLWDSQVKRVPRRVAAIIALLAADAANAIERGDLLARLEAAARTDDLTGLANRRALHDELARELARVAREGSDLSLAILDDDNFKTFNDERGHQAGDALLRDAASAWSTVLRPTDVLARYGGEEFVVLLPGCAAEEALRLVERLRAAVPHGQTCSAGIACWDGRESADTLIHRADVVLYRAKRSGRDRSVMHALAAPARTGVA